MREGPFWDVMEGRAAPPPAATLFGWELVAIDPEAGTIEVAFTASEQFLNPRGGDPGRVPGGDARRHPGPGAGRHAGPGVVRANHRPARAVPAPGAARAAHRPRPDRPPRPGGGISGWGAAR